MDAKAIGTALSKSITCPLILVCEIKLEEKMKHKKSQK
jgi:hypothetical protein